MEMELSGYMDGDDCFWDYNDHFIQEKEVAVKGLKTKFLDGENVWKL